MKFAVVFLALTAVVVSVCGHPVEPENGNDTMRPKFLLGLPNAIKNEGKKLFHLGQNFISTSKQAVAGLGGLIKQGDFQGPFLCTGCKAAVEALRVYVKTGAEDDIPTVIENTCNLLNIQTKDVCSGIANLFGPEIVPILKSDLEGLFICSFLLSIDCIRIELPDWEISLPPPPAENITPVWSPPVNGPKLKVLQITDTHYDRLYTEGAKVDCREPLCCRAENGIAQGKEKGAGKWGDWKCDIPERTLDNMLEHASVTHPDIDYIIWTGDIPAHDIWKQSKQANLEILHSTAEKIKRYFPNVPVFPAVGNHEAAPTDIFPQPGAEKSASWLYDQLDRDWSAWLPNSTSENIRTGGFYTALVRPGLRIVSLNTNYCYHRNWWLMLNSTDPAGQLEWFVRVLERAERQNEKVHVIAHVPPGQKDCLPTWRDNYYRIVSRFRNTVVNHFYGHTHKDEFEIYYSDVEEEPVGVGYIAPSVTTFTFLNPGYRIYHIDGDRNNTSRVVLDYENWIFDLEDANKNGDPKWHKSYSAKEEFQMTSLNPRAWNDLYNRLKTDSNLLQKYHVRSNKDSPEARSKQCDANCKKAILCTIRSCDKYK